MKLDLHIHTTASDGEYSPKRMIAYAKQSGIQTIAITDHDTTSGISEAISAGHEYNITVLPGIEINTQSISETHILGYFIDPDNPVLHHFCCNAAEERQNRANRICLYLKQFGIEITFEDIKKHTQGIISRVHFALALVEKGIVSTMQEAFDRYLSIPAFQTVERTKPTPEAAISMIRQAGGAPVLAHPVSMNISIQSCKDLLAQWKHVGLCGIECYSSKHTKEQTDIYLKLCEEFHLIATGGTDFHGEHIKPDIQIWSGRQSNVCFTDDSAVAALYEQAKANSAENRIYGISLGTWCGNSQGSSPFLSR